MGDDAYVMRKNLRACVVGHDEIIVAARQDLRIVLGHGQTENVALVLFAHDERLAGDVGDHRVGHVPEKNPSIVAT